MTESDKAVMQQALDALEIEQMAVTIERLVSKPHLTKAIEAIREAIAQLEQTEPPVAWQWLDSGHFRKSLPKTAELSAWRPLYANSEPVQQPVDAEQAKKLKSVHQEITNWALKRCLDAIKQGNVTIRKPLK